jgi:hypothetical protein
VEIELSGSKKNWSCFGSNLCTQLAKLRIEKFVREDKFEKSGIGLYVEMKNCF